MCNIHIALAIGLGLLLLWSSVWLLPLTLNILAIIFFGLVGLYISALMLLGRVTW